MTRWFNSVSCLVQQQRQRNDTNDYNNNDDDNGEDDTSDELFKDTGIILGKKKIRVLLREVKL